MSEGSLGNLRWLIEIDDRAALGKLDNIDAKVQALGARMSSVMGGTGVAGAPASTFGGPPISSANAQPRPFAMPGMTISDMLRPLFDSQQANAYISRSRPFASIYPFGADPGLRPSDPFGATRSTSPADRPSAYEHYARSPAGRLLLPGPGSYPPGPTYSPPGHPPGYPPPGSPPGAPPGSPPGHAPPGPIPRYYPVPGSPPPYVPPGVPPMPPGIPPGAPAPMPPVIPGAPRPGAGRGGGGFLGPPSGIGLLMSFMFGGWEIAKAYQTGQVGQTAMGLASGDVERMQASTQMIQGQYGGVFSSSIGMFQDLVGGNGPSALLRQNMTNIARVEAFQNRATAQIHLANVQRITGLGRTGEGAIMRREAAAVGEYNLVADELTRKITENRVIIADRGTHEGERVWYLGGTRRIAPNVTAEERDVAQNRLGAAQAALAAAGAGLADTKGGIAQQLAAFRDDQSRSGAAMASALRVSMIGNKLALALVGANPVDAARAQLAAIQSTASESVNTVSRQREGFGFKGVNAFVVNEVVRQQGLIAEGREVQKQARLEKRSDEFETRAYYYASVEQLNRDPRSAMRTLLLNRRSDAKDRLRDKPFELMNAMDRSFADEDLMEQSFTDQDRLIDINTRGTRRQLNYLLAQSPNPIGARSDRAATSAVSTIEQFRQQGLSRQAANTGVNALLEQKFIKQDYLDSFRAVQFDLRENAISPRDQEDPARIMASIDESVKIIKDAVANLSVEQ